MTATERALADGTIVYDVREYVGFTREGKPDRTGVTCRTRAEAKVEQAKLIAMRDGMRNRSGRCTFGQYVDRVFWPACAGLEASSRATYERELRLRLRPAFENVDIRDIDRPRIQRIVDGCATESVARKAVGLLRAILNEVKGGGNLKGAKTERGTRLLPMTGPLLLRLPLLARNPGGPFVLGAADGRISPSTAQHRWARFLRWCSETGREVPPVTIENMRHSFATSYLHAGGSVADLSVILGHADINTTLRRYVRPGGADVARGMGAAPSI